MFLLTMNKSIAQAVELRWSMRTRLINLFFVLLVFSIDLADAAEIDNLENLLVPARPDGGEFSLPEIRALISRGCTERQWVPTQDEGGSIFCSILVRGRHFVRVEIRVSEKDYSILYSDSREMNYNAEKQTIHRNYNRWVANLRLMIANQFLDPGNLETLGSKPNDTTPESALDRYEALQKLGELLERGYISEDEYQAQKDRLLGEQ